MLKNTGITFSEDLVKELQDLQKTLSTHAGVESSWSWNGKVMAKNHAGKVHTIHYGAVWEKHFPAPFPAPAVRMDIARPDPRNLGALNQATGGPPVTNLSSVSTSANAGQIIQSHNGHPAHVSSLASGTTTQIPNPAPSGLPPAGHPSFVQTSGQFNPLLQLPDSTAASAFAQHAALPRGPPGSTPSAGASYMSQPRGPPMTSPTSSRFYTPIPPYPTMPPSMMSTPLNQHQMTVTMPQTILSSPGLSQQITTTTS